MIIETLKDLLEIQGLLIAGEVERMQASLSHKTHLCIPKQLLHVPSFPVVDVRVYTDEQYSPCGRWIEARYRFRQYTVSNALILHQDTTELIDQDSFRDATLFEGACAFASMPWLGSIRCRLFSSAALTLQVWKKPDGLIWATKMGSSENHHRLLVPKTIEPYW